MNPWIILGWIVVGLIGLRLAWALGQLAVGLLLDARDSLRLWLANRGHLGCQHREADRLGGETSCHNVATRRTPNGFYCEEHFNDRRNAQRRTGIASSISYAFVLDYYKDEHQRRLES